MMPCSLSARVLACLLLACLLAPAAASAAEPPGTISGTVRDASGAVITGAVVELQTAQQISLRTTRTDGSGNFRFEGVPAGRYVIYVAVAEFSARRVAVTVEPGAASTAELVVEPMPIASEVTVTASPGVARDVQAVSQPVNVIDSSAILERASAVVAEAVLEEPGLNLLRTSSTMGGIYVRGLTGNKVNIFVDGVRYSNSAQRGGVNTFLDLIEPSSLQTIEVLRGPNSAQYGSDALGGSVQFLSVLPALASPGAPAWSGNVGVRASSAEQSVGTNLSVAYAGPKVGVLASVAGRDLNLVRTGKGIDSHAAITRFFGLPSSALMDERLPDTAFTQYGGSVKLNWVPRVSEQVVVSYTHNTQPDGKRYDQLLGGDGNLIADLSGVMMDSLYVRFHRASLGPFDEVTATYSFNTQREERINQGGNGNPRASITHEFERMYAHGFQVKAVARAGERQELLLGAEVYPEHIKAPSYAVNPVTGVSTVRRGRVPDGARYLSEGIYAQDSYVLVPGRLTAVGDLRYSGAHYRAYAADSPVANGAPLWPDDTMDTSSVTFRAGIVATPATGLSLTANVSRGFRAPHITDLGTLGLTGSGYTVSATEVGGMNATIGDAAGATAVTTGQSVTPAGPETSLNYEAGISYRGSRVATSASAFVNTIYDNIAYQALILPQGAVGLTLGDQTISAQTAGGAVYVPAASNPVLVRVNYGDARITGFEHRFDWIVTPRWSVGTVLTLLHAEDLATGSAPNIEGGTPGPDVWLKLRYTAPGARFWAESVLHGVGEQTRLSTLDLEDRRTGATRTRTNIRNFFLNGATARGWVNTGPDGVIGTADDVLASTGETVAQIQDRVLGTAVSAPLYTSVHGYLTLGFRGGFRIGGRNQLMLALENVTDRNYRGIAWGLDAPGRHVSFAWVTRF